MARGVNKVILVGNLGRDPETRYTQNGSAVTQFSIATSDSWRDKSTGEQQDRTEWHNIVCFARLAEIAGEYLKKGSKVYIEGSLRTSNWEQDGQKRYRTEVMARELQMLDSRANGGGQAGEFSEPSYAAGAAGQQPASMPQNSPTISDEDFEDDIPFCIRNVCRLKRTMEIPVVLIQQLSLHFQINEMTSSVFGQALKTDASISTSSIFD